MHEISVNETRQIKATMPEDMRWMWLDHRLWFMCPTWNSSLYSVSPTLASTVSRLSWAVMMMLPLPLPRGAFREGQLEASEEAPPT